LITASAQCLRLSERFFIFNFLGTRLSTLVHRLAQHFRQPCWPTWHLAMPNFM